MRIHLVNPSDVSFGTAVITPRWQYVLAAATPARHGTPLLVDETLEPIDEASSRPATSSASASIPGMRCAGIASGKPREHEERSSSSAAFTPRCSLTKRARMAARTRW